MTSRQEQVPGTGAMAFGPTIGSYAGFCGIWIVLALANVALWVVRRDPALVPGVLIAGGVACGTILWMAGHRMRIADSRIWYRDGFYRVRSLKIDEVTAVRDEWEALTLLGRTIKFPRICVDSGREEDVIRINPKPFSGEALKTVRTVLSGRAGA